MRALFARHGIPKHRQVPVTGDILGLSYNTIYKRLPAGPWSLEELEKVAAHFGESLVQLVDPASQVATFVVGAVRMPCKVAMGAATNPGKPASLIAVRGDREWLVMPPSEAVTARSYDVTSVTIAPEVQGCRVAVLDDEPEIAEAICADLRDMGFDAQAYFSIEGLSKDIKMQSFDAFIVDWIVGKQTTRQLIADIRVQDQLCPIAILTGQLEEGGDADEAEVAIVSAGENMQFYTKPLPVQVIGHRLKKALGFPAAVPSRGGR
jgi:CheY-like chemotaxis protein